MESVQILLAYLVRTRRKRRIKAEEESQKRLEDMISSNIKSNLRLSMKTHLDKIKLEREQMEEL